MIHHFFLFVNRFLGNIKNDMLQIVTFFDRILSVSFCIKYRFVFKKASKCVILGDFTGNVHKSVICLVEKTY